jgi:hypothetical protein
MRFTQGLLPELFAMKWNIQCFFVLLGILTTQSACSDLPKEYSADPIEAWVLDAGTKKPLEGVIVTVNWELLGGMEGSQPLGQMKVMETVTDKTGRFYFPAWGPEPRTRGYLREAPQLLLFKPGYEYRRLDNEYHFTPEERAQKVRRSDWNGKTIEMKAFKGTAQQYAHHLGFLNNDLYTLIESETCDWKKIPRMLLALTEQSRVFRKQGIEALYDVDQYLPVSERKCGSPRTFFNEYQP